MGALSYPQVPSTRTNSPLLAWQRQPLGALFVTRSNNPVARHTETTIADFYELRVRDPVRASE